MKEMHRIKNKNKEYTNKKQEERHLQLSELRAYEIIEEKELADIHSKGCILRHKKSGARISLIENDDENRVFYIGFRTPAEDSTGVPHIIEHTVLCGSDEFPVKDPFVELVKGSLNTFLNAMTYPDKTVYPVASCNEKDFQNLMHVYMDAVFHPNIYKYQEIFKQEGWHYELESADAPLTLNGVVYNEMKGAYSTPESVLEHVSLKALFPDTAYANDSGGAPEHIPDLTYEQYLDFHRRYYHPSNAYIYLYGDLDFAEKLQWMDEAYLSHYDKIDPDSAIELQKPFGKPAEVTERYPIASSESEEGNTYLSYDVAVGTALDRQICMAFDVLDYALLNAPGAPLKKALLDAGVGKDIIGGYETSLYQPVFSITAKNANASDKEKFVETVERVLREQAAGALNKKALRAGINSNEFRFREADFGSYPKGLIYGLQCFDSWLYDDNAPFLFLEALDTFRFLKEQAESGYFENLIQTYLLENAHKAVIVVNPEKGLNEKREKELEQKLAAYKASLSEEETAALVADTVHLKEYQQEPSPKEALAKIPMLTRADMKKEAAPLYNEETALAGIPALHHNLYSNGIQYVDLLFDLSNVREEQIPYLGVLKAALGYMDTERHTYEDLANEINLHTGGIYSSLNAYMDVKHTDSMRPKYEVRIKTLYGETEAAFSLVREILCTTKFGDAKRLYEIIAQAKSRLQMQLSQAGHSASAVRAMSYFSPAARFNDMVGGIAFYRLLTELEADFENKKEQVQAVLEELAHTIFQTAHLFISATCDEEGFALLEPQAQALNAALSGGKREAEGEFCMGACGKKNEGFKEASQVQYVSRGGNFIKDGFSYTGALRILKVILNYDYLWMNIRVKGGAYGCMSGFGRNGDTYFSTYRDPNLRRSNEVFDGIPAYLEQFDADERDMARYIIGTVSELDAPLTPSAKGARSLTAYLSHVTDADFQKERDEVLSASPEDIRRLKDLTAAVLAEENLCVIGNETALEKESGLFFTVEDLF